MTKIISSYKKSGVNYDILDKVKVLAQKFARITSVNLSETDFREYQPSRGESAYVIEYSDCFIATVEEGLGTKNLVADEVRKITGRSYYDSIAYDTVAMIINDLVTVGSRPLTVLAYWSVGDSNWFTDEKRLNDLVMGWERACNDSACTWGGGETPTLKDIIYPTTINLAGAAFGVVRPKKRLVVENSLKSGDVILFFESSGIHANGLTLARKIAKRLKDSYSARLTNGKTYGEDLLIPTIIYSKLINELLDTGVAIHYMVNITGHGWRKIMRANKNFTYVINNTGVIPPLFTFIQKQASLSDSEMYATFNMGVGFAIMVGKSEVDKIIKISAKHKIKCWVAGKVEQGAKQVVIKQKNIIYSDKDLKIR